MQYFYEALDSSGQLIVGKVDGNSVDEVKTRISQQGYQLRSLAPDMGTTGTLLPNAQNLPVVSAPLPQSVAVPAPPVARYATPVQAQPRSGMVLAGNAAKVASRQKAVPQGRQIAPGYQLPHVSNVSNMGGVNDKERLLFFTQLQSLVYSGMSVYMALDSLAGRTQNRNLTLVIREMRDAAHNGRPISAVMARYPHIFPEHVTATLSGGELGGFLEIALSEIALDYEQRVALYRWVWLPKLIFALSFFAIPLIIPLMPSFYETAMTGKATAFFALYLKRVLFYFPVSLGLFGGVILLSRKFQQPKYRYKRDEWSLKMPPFGTLQRQIALGNFVRMLRRLHHAGVSPTQAWEGAMLTASNVVLRDKLAQSYAIMQKGASLGDAFAQTGLFDNSIEQLIITGEQSGQLGEMLDRAAGFYQQEADNAKKRVQMAMFRMGCIGMMIASGFTACWLAYTYFQGAFHFVDTAFPELNN